MKKLASLLTINEIVPTSEERLTLYYKVLGSKPRLPDMRSNRETSHSIGFHSVFCIKSSTAFLYVSLPVYVSDK